VVDIKLPPALGFTKVDPVRRLVAGSAKARDFDKGFDQDGTVSFAEGCASLFFACDFRQQNLASSHAQHFDSRYRRLRFFLRFLFF
jgi:hypothetical protein